MQAPSRLLLASVSSAVVLALAALTLAPSSDATIAPREREGIVPRSSDGKPLNLGFELGSLEGWTATGDAFKGQPVRGDTVGKRRRDQASEHVGEYWLGGYEIAGDAPTGTLTSDPFAVTHPWASFLVGGGRHAETRVEIVDAESGAVIKKASGT
ncbi:MAG TPA: hypothetical protein VK116_20005, partial [Planctomycetota bacterium]|nr:hypothetical protein [Planctomycetota bacterium]